MPILDATDAFPVISRADWYKVASIHAGVECWGVDVFEAAERHSVVSAYWVNKDGEQIGVEAL